MKKLLITLVWAMFFYGTQAQDTVRYPDRWYGYTPREALMEYTGRSNIPHDGSCPQEHRWFDSSIHYILECNRPTDQIEKEKNFDFMRYVEPGVNQKMYGIAITMYPEDFDTLDGSLLAYFGVTKIANGHDNTGIFYAWSVDTIFSIPLSNPPLMKQCVFEYDYSLPTVKSFYSNCYEFYFDEPLDLLPNNDTYIGTTACGFPHSRMTLGLDTARRQAWYHGLYSESIIPGFVNEYPYNVSMEKPIWFVDGKFVEYYNVPGYEDFYWDDSYWGMIFPILSPRCTAPKDFRIAYSEERLDTVLWRGDPESDVFQVSVASYPASPDSGMITTVTDTTFVLPHHSIDTLLVAYVRKMCTFEFDTHTDTVWGDWAGPVLVAGDTTGLGGGDTTSHGGDTTGIATADLQQISITPNPATGTVTVRSAEQMTEVEVVDIVGASVLRQQASGLVARLDVKALPRGSYIVRIHTPMGVTARKLILQ